ncbi:hypothetical protein YY63_24745 [Salmonella enterica subsp. enterica]|nr:hypothetical protein [Salmonella enterica subsp. enterica serovar Oranienburg]MIP07491.1 hypothetical protein [Salmonella enterica subsp. enterica serovar Oranienburg]
MIIKKIFVAIFPLTLSACSHYLPLDYTNYEGSDSATLYVLNKAGNVGTIYLGSYKFNEKTACYDMVDRYELDSNIFQSKGNVIVSKVKPGIQYSVSQIKNEESSRQGGKLINHVYNYNTSIITEAGKYYYIVPGNHAVEVSPDFVPDPWVSWDRINSQYKDTPIKSWDIKKICSTWW